MSVVEQPDCGDSSCRYAAMRGGMRTNGHCRCDECPSCGRHISQLVAKLNPLAAKHRHWCKQPEWLAPWQRGAEVRR